MRSPLTFLSAYYAPGVHWHACAYLDALSLNAPSHAHISRLPRHLGSYCRPVESAVRAGEEVVTPLIVTTRECTAATRFTASYVATITPPPLSRRRRLSAHLRPPTSAHIVLVPPQRGISIGFLLYISSVSGFEFIYAHVSKALSVQLL